MRILLTAVLLLPAVSVDFPPVTPTHVIAGFRAPVDRYGPGHRGVDLTASPGQAVFAPIDGRVTFSGRVAGRDVLSITDGFRRVTLEPVSSPLRTGSDVIAGALVGTVGVGGHCAGRCLHVGLRVDGEFVPPLAGHARLVP